MTWDYTSPWYHGSPFRLTTISAGSTVTQDMDLARVFSHKPTIVSQDSDDLGRPIIKHTGTVSGYLYRVIDVIGEPDVYPHPETTMGLHQEWLTTRELRVELLGPTVLHPSEILTPSELETLLNKHRRSLS